MNNHLMIDFETLGKNPDTAVLSLGAVLFNREKIIDSKEWTFDLKEQLRAKRSIDPATLLWWLEQGPDAQKVLSKSTKDGQSVHAILPAFHSWVLPHKVKVWGCGASFDIPIIESLLQSLKLDPPWAFWDIRCYRTMKAMLDIEMGHKFQGTKHNALADATHQATVMMAYLQKNPKQDK